MGDPEETTTWERARERGVTEEQWARFEDVVAEMFSAFGMDLDTEGTRDTPRRFVERFTTPRPATRATRSS